MIFRPFVLLALAGASIALATDQPERVEDPGRAAVGQHQAVRQFDDVDALLEAVDEADRQTNTLRGTIRHIVVNALAGDTQVRDGRLSIQTDWDAAADDAEGLPTRRFAVEFRALIVDNKMTHQARDYVFDGTWLLERDHTDKQANRWQLVPEGERFDPMDRLGGSAVWIPVGQDTLELRKRFEVQMLGPMDWFDGEMMPPGLKDYAQRDGGTVQLRLVPKPGTGLEDDWEEIRMWFDSQTLLPRVHVVLEPTGDEQISILYNVKRNEPLDAQVFMTALPNPDEGWEISEHPYRKSVEASTTVRPTDDSGG